MKNFELIQKKKIKELNGTAKLYRHRPTGAEILSIENRDTNKVFGITFRTPPSDSTGVAHILEHSVLCGSRKYPLKDPFVQLLKGSLQTFLNAMTYPDKTVYPVASQNETDFYNLVDVYLDAVFFPRITPAFFKQEGRHYELEHLEAPLTCKGVVYNEMKGVYSSPDSLLLERSQQALFPDTTYGLDSGGCPSDILNLTYADFHHFHETYYHPSNARIFFAGNDDPERRFTILEEYLSGFSAKAVDSTIAIQKPFAAPIEIKEPYAATEESGDKAFITLNWAIPDGFPLFALAVLDHILTGTPGSPLRKALIESGLGEDIAGGGFETQMLQPMFSIGMKGVETEKTGTVQELILNTLRNLSENGIEPGETEAALNTFEFDLRENNPGSFPQGLAIMLHSMETWLYDDDPLALIAYEKPLRKLKKLLQAEPCYFEAAIRHLFLDNPHRATVKLLPDTDKARRDEAEERDRLEADRREMTKDDLNRVIASAKRLREMQETPDTPDAIKTLPMLSLRDLRPEIRTVPREIETVEGATVLFHELFTGGIAYCDIGFDLHTLPAEDLPWVSLLGTMLLEMGTAKEDFVSLSQRIARETGGIYATPFHSTTDHSETGISRLFLRGKCMSTQTGKLFAIYRDILLASKFDQPKRFREILLEHKASMESALVPSGHSAVLSRLGMHYGEAYRAAEAMSGIKALFFHRELIELAESDRPATLARFERILATLLSPENLVINITADPHDRANILASVKSFLRELPNEKASHQAWTFNDPPPRTEALTAPTRVNYVGQACNLFENGYEMHGSALVVTRYLRTAWLWEQIRVLGGAYGAICRFDPHSGALCFASYRDPNLADTLKVYNRTADYLKTLQLDEDERTRAIVGTIGGIDAYQLPDAKGYADTARWLTGYTSELRQQRRDEVLNTTAEDFQRFAGAMATKEKVISVLSSADRITKSGLPFDRTLRVL